MSKSRVTVVEHIYFQPLGAGQPSVTQRQFNRTLLTEDEQPCVRLLKATEEWKAIDKCWLEQAGMVHLFNEAGSERRTIPNEREKEELSRMIVEVSFNGEVEFPLPALKVLPGETARFHPIDLSQLRYRCCRGEVKITLTIFPV